MVICPVLVLIMPNSIAESDAAAIRSKVNTGGVGV
jgi:hypothetical protein